MNRRHTVIVFCALSKQVSAGHICETELMAFAIGTFHGDYKPGGRDTIRPVGGY
jgi:fructose/tagatose bisphosphate aldolase